MPILEIERLTKRFGDTIAVDQMSLNVEEGEIFGFLGANGAGKSTTIEMVTGLLRKNSGTIKVLGKDTTKHKMFIKQNIGFVPQSIAIYEDLTAYENVKFFAGLYGLRGKELHMRTLEALEFVDLTDKQKVYPKKFSGGMKRRLNIACAIAHRPKLIIMDEPTVGIDPQSRKYILDSVRKLNEMGCTIIYTSHYMEEIEEICSRVAIIDQGQIIVEGTKEELKALITNHKVISIQTDAADRVDTGELQEIPGVLSVHIKENEVLIQSEIAVNNLNRIIAHFISKDWEIRSLDEKEPTLETVFLTLTGRSLRDSH